MSKKRTRPAPRKKRSAPKKPSPMIWAGLSLLVLIPLVLVWGWLSSGPDFPEFDGERAFADLVRQTDFGPRNPGSEGHAQCREFLLDALRQTTPQVATQLFSYADQRDTTRVYNATNLIASFNPQSTRRVMLSAHWDTRPWADQDPDSAYHQTPILGANDGASGVAVLLEMARVFQAEPPPIGVDLIFFDLEDLGDPDPNDRRNPFAIGSTHFAENNPDYRPMYGILLDMVGSAELRLVKEAFSNFSVQAGYEYANAREVVNKVWAAADRVGADAFVDELGGGVEDDHVPFLKKGIKVIDLIDQDYMRTHWHTRGDTPDKCAPESLQQIGDVLVDVIYREPSG